MSLDASQDKKTRYKTPPQTVPFHLPQMSNELCAVTGQLSLPFMPPLYCLLSYNFCRTLFLISLKTGCSIPPTSNVQWIVCTDGLAFTSHCRQTVSPFRIRSPSNVEDIFKLTEGRSEKERLIRSENSQKLLTIAKNEGQTLFSSSAKAQVWKM